MSRNNYLALLMLLLAACHTQALPQDAEQEMVIFSDTAELDRKAGIVIYKGNVVLTQGTLTINSDRLMILRNGDVLEKAVAEGKPAVFKQQLSADQGLTTAEGQRIDYFALRKEIHIKGQGRLLQEGNEFNGEKITYDMTRERILATSENDEGTTSERIKVVIQPKAEGTSQP